MNCIVCETKLIGRQKKFCSRICQNQSTNKRYQDYKSQQQRGFFRRIELIRLAGGCCQICGYKKNYSALNFHHLDPYTKKFNIDLRKCSNSTWEKLLVELQKCQLLCSNCHAEIHHPNCNLF